MQDQVRRKRRIHEQSSAEECVDHFAEIMTLHQTI